jgi:Telomere resolvase
VVVSPDLLRDEVVERFRYRIGTAGRLRLSKDDLASLIDGFVGLLKGVVSESEIKSLCEAEIRLLEEGYPQPTVAKYLTVYRKAIVRAIADGSVCLTDGNSHHFVHQQRVTGLQEERLEHWALTYLKYAPEVYEAIGQRSQLANRGKQLNLRLVPVDLYLKLLREFLHCSGLFADRWLAVAIAGLTGRRFAEVVAKGTFSLTEHSHRLHFEGQQKSARSEGYDILTLIPAQDVLDAISRLRQFPEVKAISRLKGEEFKTALNLLNRKLNAMCGAALREVVPPLDGKQTVTIHNLRGLYGAIAVYLFCPLHQHEYAFIQHYLGHVMSSPATGHYFRYALADAQGKPLRDKGVSLSGIGVLPVPMSDYQEEMMIKKQRNGQDVPVGEAQSTPDQWLTVLAELRSDFESRLSVLEQRSGTSWIINRIETLEVENLSLRQERDEAISFMEQNQGSVAELQRLRAENEILAQNLRQAQSKLDGFRQLLNGTDAIDSSVPKAAQMLQEPPISLEEVVPVKRAHTRQESVREAPGSYSKVRGPKSGKAFQRAEAIFLAIKDWNHLYPSESFAINPGLLETVFRVHRQAAKDFFEAYQNELWEYHQELGVESPRWHNRGKDTEKLKVFVLEKLGV